MSRKIPTEVITYYNNELRGIVNRTIKRELGVNVDMHLSESGELTDNLADVDKKMRGNKILRQLFKSARLYGYLYEFEDEVEVMLYVGYNHTNGGSNGHEMMTLWINKGEGKNKKVNIRK